MKKYVIIAFLFTVCPMSAQMVTGKLVDENGAGLIDVQIQLFIGADIYTSKSDSIGNFCFENITDVEYNQLPSGYLVSNNYPNPFNPVTRFNIVLPKNCEIQIYVYNILGQMVAQKSAYELKEGTNYIDLELSGLSNGIYFAGIVLDDKYTVVKKMVLLYGSRHLAYSQSGLAYISDQPENNSCFFIDTKLDSLVAASSIIGRIAFTNLPNISGGLLNLGNLLINRFCPGLPAIIDSRDGKSYKTVQIGGQCWFKENINIGIMINGDEETANNTSIEKYCYGDNPENCEIYGGLYTWNEAMQYSRIPGSQGICPQGWHIPSIEEIQILSLTVDEDGNSLKEIGQGVDGGTGTNTSGFSALLSGRRYHYDYGDFDNLNASVWLLSSSENQFQNEFALNMHLINYDYYIGLSSHLKELGHSLRCVKD